MKHRFRVEDALKQFHRAEYEGWLVTADALAGLVVRDLVEAGELLERLREDEFIKVSGRGFGLTESGRRYALQVVRAHRMFETWLARKTGTDASDWHRMAEKAEHTLTEVEIEAESRMRKLDRVEGRQIQVIRAVDEEVRPEWSRLSELKKGEVATIAALSAVCRGGERLRLLDLGVVPGSRVRVDLTGPFASPRGYRIRATLVGLRDDQAQNIFVKKEAV